MTAPYARERRLADALAAAEVGAFTYWPDENRTDWEPEVYAILGVDPSVQLSGTAYMTHVHPEDRPTVSADVTAAAERGAGFDHRYRWQPTPDAPYVWIRARARPREAEGRRWVTGVLWDITAEVEAEARVLRSERVAATAQLVAGIAHELNTPLGALSSGVATVSAAVQRLDPDARPARAARSAASAAQSAADRISTVVQALLRFANLDRSEVGELDLASAVREVPGLFADRFGGIEVGLTLEGDPLWPCRAADVRQALTTVLINAAEATARGPHPEATIAVSVDTRGELAEVRVSDRGAGLSAEQLGTVLEPSLGRRADRVAARFGLPIAAQTCRDHGGQLTLASPGPGQGATCRLTLGRASD